MDPAATPVAQKPRHVPYHLQEPLKKWIEQGVEEEIFEKVPDGEPITWCSPLVVQPKPKYAERETLEPQMIRASICLGNTKPIHEAESLCPSTQDRRLCISLT